MNDALLNILACPKDGSALSADGTTLVCGNGHEYQFVQGMPVLLRDDVEQTGWWSELSLQKAREAKEGIASIQNNGEKQAGSNGIAQHVQEAVAATCGYLYQPLIGKLNSYPIPELRLPAGDGQLFLDIGCNWGRWSIAAARKGYRVVGMDPNVEAVIAARQISSELGVECDFVVGDTRYLPFQQRSFDVVFSYSVIQHLSKADAKESLRQIASALRPNGFSFIQMPNRYGLRSTYHLVRRGFSEGSNFDVRYWTPSELKQEFQKAIGPTELSVDGFFGLGIQPSDIDLLPARLKSVVRASEILRKWSDRMPILAKGADSLYAKSHRVNS